jgi:MFS family permease
VLSLPSRFAKGRDLSYADEAPSPAERQEWALQTSSPPAWAAVRRWPIPWAVMSVSLGMAVALLGDSLLYAVLPTRPSSFGVSVAMVGVLLSVNRFVRLVSNPAAAAVFRRFGSRMPFYAALAATVVATATYGLAKGFWILLWARILWGVCFSLLRLGGYAAVLEVSTESNRGFFMGFYQGVSRLGSLAGVLLGGLLTDVLGQRETILLFAGITALGLPLALVGREGQARTRETSVAVGKGRAEAALPYRCAGAGSTASAVGSEPATRANPLAINYAAFAHGLVISGLVTGTLGFLLREQFGSEVGMLSMTVGVATLTGSLLSLRWFSDLGLGAYLGYLSDRWGRRRVIFNALLWVCAALLVLVFVAPLAAVVPAVVSMFVAATALTVSLDSAAGDVAARTGDVRVMTRYATWLDLGAALGPIIGLALGTLAALRAVYLGGGVILVSAAVLYLVAQRPVSPGGTGTPSPLGLHEKGGFPR